VKKLFESWRRMLNEGRKWHPKSKSDGQAPDPGVVAYRSPTAWRDKKKEKPPEKTDDVDGAVEPPFKMSGKTARRHRGRKGQGAGKWSPRERAPKNEGEDSQEGTEPPIVVTVRVKSKELE